MSADDDELLTPREVRERIFPYSLTDEFRQCRCAVCVAHREAPQDGRVVLTVTAERRYRRERERMGITHDFAVARHCRGVAR